MTKLILLFLILLTTPFAYAADVDIDYYFKVGEDINLRRECFNNGDICGSTFDCNVSVYDPENFILIDNEAMTNQISYYNSTLSKNYTDGTFIPTGTYRSRMTCTDGAESGTEIFYFKITNTGDENNNWVFLIMAGLSLIFFIIAYISKNNYLGFIAGTSFLVTGIYTVIYGFAGEYDIYTRGIGFVFIGLGILFTITASIEAIQE